MGGDIGKGVLAIFTAKWLGFLPYSMTLALIITSFFVVLGHNYSIFLKFREGGRGIASTGGVVIALNPYSFLIGLGTLLLSIIIMHYLLGGRVNWRKFSSFFSAAGSQIVGRVVGLFLVLVAIYLYSPEIFLPTLTAMVLVLIKHIQRLKTYIVELRTQQQ
jgi:glycerol-3-phosphate acyltransferase PlsY